MCKLKVEVKSMEHEATYYTGTYNSKQFEMKVDYRDYEYTLISGKLTKDEWEQVVVKFYHGDYE